MPIGFFKSRPNIKITLDKESYAMGDELRARVTVTTERPGMTVRRAVVELVQENRYTQTSMVSVGGLSDGRAGAGGTRGSASTGKRITEERTDRVVIGQERLFSDGVISQRTETFDLLFEIKPPATRRATQKGLSYEVYVHFDLPRMRDVEIHKAVPVQLA